MSEFDPALHHQSPAGFTPEGEPVVRTVERGGETEILKHTSYKPEGGDTLELYGHTLKVRAHLRSFYHEDTPTEKLTGLPRKGVLGLFKTPEPKNQLA